MGKEKITEKKSSKYTKLILGVIFDLMGLISFVVPGVGEFTDVIWAPVAAYLVIRMYKGTAGKVGGAIALIEEGFPALDVIPTFTIMWIYTYIIKRKRPKKNV